MRYFPAAAAALLAVLTLSGCDTAQTDPSAETQESIAVFRALPLPDLYVEIPEGYETTSSAGYEEYYVKDDASIIVTEDTSQTFFSSAYDYAISALRQYEEMTHTLSNPETEVVYAGKQAVQTLSFTYTLDEEDTYPLTTLIGYVTDGSSMYILTCKSAADTFDTHRGEFLSVLQSISLIKS